MIKINFGCGSEIKSGWINVDYMEGRGVDKVVNLNSFPYPFKDNSVDQIYSSHNLEHLEEPCRTIKEFHRIFKNQGIITIKVPHFTSPGAFSPLHKTYWNCRVFQHFYKNTKWNSDSLDEFIPLFKKMQIKINFKKGKILWNHLIEKIVNINEFTRLLYENHFCFMFPAHDIIVNYRK